MLYLNLNKFIEGLLTADLNYSLIISIIFGVVLSLLIMALIHFTFHSLKIFYDVLVYGERYSDRKSTLDPSNDLQGIGS